MSGYVYLVSAGPHQKVGITNDINRRICQIQTGCSDRVIFVSSFWSDDPLRDEKEIHRFLYGYHVRGEWFEIPNELLMKRDEWFKVSDQPPGPEQKKPVKTNFDWLIESLPY